MYKQYIKRFLDFSISVIALCLLSPVFLLVFIVLSIANKGAGAFFIQDRPGKNGKLFKIIKFKTMSDMRSESGELLPDIQRFTTVGKLIRSLSLDEIPQLINVIKGDMSLIGPRPLLPQYLLVFDKIQMRRHEVRPGISGWAQVHGRNHCKLSKKFEMDVWYVDHCTLLTDIKIVALTIKNVVARTDVGAGAGDMKEVDDLNFGSRLKEIKKQTLTNENAHK